MDANAVHGRAISRSRSLLLCGAASATALLSFTTPALSQNAAPADSANLDEVVVTGSRTRRSGVDSPTPVTVSSMEQLKLGAPSTITEALFQLPQFRGSSRPGSGATTTSRASGASQLNLRNLGAQRNLVLLDGRRGVPSSNIGVTDINTFPEALVQRVEVVTGGASAAYGSDAVAGVVNFILDTRFSGLKGEISGGISEVGDGDAQKASLSFGTPFASGRGHFVASAEYYRSDGISPLDMHRRDWARRSAGIIPNVPGTATPNRFIFGDNVYLSSATYGGLITSTTLRDIMFGPGGVPQTFVPGTLRSATFMLGGTPTRQEFNLTASLERWNVFGHATYDLTDKVELFAQVSASKSTTGFLQAYNFLNSTTAFTIFSGNPFLPASIQSQMTAQNIPSFRLGRIMGEGELIDAVQPVEVTQAVVGFKGEVNERLRYDGYVALGRSEARVDNRNIMNFNKVFAAVDAVRDPATGNIVCRSTLLFGQNPDCVPLNPFGQGSPSQAAISYYQDDIFRALEVDQQVAALNVQGELFALWSRPIAFAAGVEYRREKSTQTVDAISPTNIDFTNIRGAPAALNGMRGPMLIGNFSPLSGEISVKEAYGELDIPILKDAPFANSLDVNVAARVADYSTSGLATTWKVTGSYSPVRDLRFRATRSRDIRAPNVAELFSGSSQSTGTIRTPAGATVNQIGRITGNPDLEPEKADTLTAGAVYKPSWLPGFEMSIDYFRIDIKGAIGFLTQQQTVDECARGSAIACSNITILANGDYRLNQPNLNLSLLEASGVDFEASFRRPAFAGDVEFRVLGNYQGQLRTTTPGAPPINRAGEAGPQPNEQQASPKWQVAATVRYTQGPLSVFVQERFISKSVYNAAWTEGVEVDDNTIKSAFYTDLTLTYRIDRGDRNLVLFGTVNNLFDRDPPLAPFQSASLLRNSNFQVYDGVGRYYTMGLRFAY